MGRVTFSEENKTQAVGDFPKLKLEAGERKRIVCVEDPVAEYVHRLEMPKIENGSAKMVKRDRKDGTQYDDYDMDFVGAPLCLGDEGILAERGVDPKNCPACEMASKGDMTKPPQRRFAMHVIVYNTKPGGFELQSPYGCQVVIWSFTGKKFDKLVDFQKEWGSLQDHDLLLGPCTNKMYQNYEIAIAASAEWKKDQERQRITLETFRENQTKDLASFCGRKTEKRWLDDDLQKIKDRWQEVNGTTSQSSASSAAEQSFDAGTLTQGLDDLLSTQTGSTASDSTPETAGIDPFAAVKNEVPTEEATTPPSGDEEPALSAKPGSSGETVSFDDLLKGM